MNMNADEQILKYISEEGAVLSKAFENRHRIDDLLCEAKFPRELRRIYLIGCGSSFNEAMASRHALEAMTGLTADAVPAWEFITYTAPAAVKEALVVAYSQSGTTDVVCDACAWAVAHGAVAVGVTDVLDSRLAQVVGFVASTYVGQESVGPKTKGFSTAVMATYLLGLALAKWQQADGAMIDRCERSLGELPGLVAQLTEDVRPQMASVASQFVGAHDLFVLGAGPNWGTAEEGALKIVEMARIHSEGMELEEIRHGRLRIVNPNTPVVLMAPRISELERVVALEAALKTKRAPTLILTDRSGASTFSADLKVTLPSIEEIFSPLVNVVPLQLLAVELAIRKGLVIK